MANQFVHCYELSSSNSRGDQIKDREGRWANLPHNDGKSQYNRFLVAAIRSSVLNYAMIKQSHKIRHL